MAFFDAVYACALNDSSLVEHRNRFPVLRDRSYFASQCLGPFPAAALEDLEEYRRTLFLRSRSLELWLERMYELIALLETFLHAPPGSVALRDSATAGQAAIAAAIEAKPQRDRIVYAPALDFKSSRYLWTQQSLRGFAVTPIGVEQTWLSADEICAAIDERVAIVALPLVSPQTGAVVPWLKLLSMRDGWVRLPWQHVSGRGHCQCGRRSSGSRCRSGRHVQMDVRRRYGRSIHVRTSGRGRAAGAHLSRLGRPRESARVDAAIRRRTGGTKNSTRYAGVGAHLHCTCRLAVSNRGRH